MWFWPKPLIDCPVTKKILRRYVPELNDLQLQAKALLDRFGPFVRKAERDAITANVAFEDWHDSYNDKKLQKAVDKIKAKVSDLLIEVKSDLASPEPEVKEAQLTDAEVAAGIRYLTGQDADKASLANDRGWMLPSTM